jgi:type VI protein secretion system component VasF
MFAALGCRGGDEVVAELNLCEGGLRAHRSQWTVALPVFRALGHDPHYRRDSHMAELRRRRDELLQLLARTRGQKEILVPRFDPPTRALLPGSDWVKWGTVAAGVLAAALLAWSGRGTLARWLQEAGEAVRGLLGRGAEQFRGILATMRRDR